MGNTKNDATVAKTPPAVSASHTKETTSEDTSGISDIFSVYFPSVSKSTTETCRLISTSALTYVIADASSSPSVAVARYVTAPAPRSDAPNM